MYAGSEWQLPHKFGICLRSILPFQPAFRLMAFSGSSLVGSPPWQLAARGASLDSQRKRLRDSQRSSLQCAHGDGATRAAATTRGVLDRAHGATPDSGAPFL